MEIVINIPDEEYKCIQITGCIGNKTCVSNSIYKGTPIPKGHGRLIDVSEYFEKEFGDAREFLDNATTVIAAEKGAEK